MDGFVFLFHISQFTVNFLWVQRTNKAENMQCLKMGMPNLRTGNYETRGNPD